MNNLRWNQSMTLTINDDACQYFYTQEMKRTNLWWRLGITRYNKRKLDFTTWFFSQFWLCKDIQKKRNSQENDLLFFSVLFPIGSNHKNSVQNHHKKKFILKSDSGSKIVRFLPFGSNFASERRGWAGHFLHTSTHSVQILGLFWTIFCTDSLFCKHAKFSKVNAFLKFGVDFFQPSAAFFRQKQA